MIEISQILSVADKIAKQFQPECIILFGSYAYGTPTEDSDVDLSVITPFEGKGARKSIEIEGAVHQGFPMDLIAITPELLQERLEMQDFFLHEAVAAGKVLYEAQH